LHIPWVNFADKAVLGLAAIPIIKEFHLSPALYGLLGGSFFWLFALSSVVVTAWTDTAGTKRILALLAATWSLVQFSTLFVTSFFALLLTRVLLGAGEGPSYGTSVIAASKWLPTDRYAFGIGMVTFGSSIGPAFFAPLLTLLIVEIGWRAAFTFLGAIGVLWIVIWLLVARERPAEGSIPLRETQVTHHETRWREVLPIIFSRNILLSILAAFCVYWQAALLLTWTPVYLVIVRHLTLTSPLYNVGVSFPWVLQGLALIAFAALADRIFRRTGSVRCSYVLLAGTLLILGAVFIYSAMNISSALGAVSCFALAATAGAAIPLLVAIILNVTPEEHRGFCQGAAVAISTLPGFIAPFVTGLIIQATGNHAVKGLYNAYLLAALMLLIGGVGLMVFARPDEATLP